MKITVYQPQTIFQLGARSNQEDSVFPAEGKATVYDHLFVLCDGMGGHERGEVASNAVCETLAEQLVDTSGSVVLTDDTFKKAIDLAYQKLDSLDTREPESSDKPMGTTMTCLCMHRGGVLMAHIGDSRIYHIRPSERRILYKSRDHSLVYDLFMAGEIKREEMATAHNKNIITRAMITHQEQPSKADIAHTTDIQPGDYFYMCSDGMLEQMDDEEILQIFCSSASDEEKRATLTERTQKNKDNHSAHIIRVRSVTTEELDHQMPNDEATTKCNAMVWERPVGLITPDSRPFGGKGKAASARASSPVKSATPPRKRLWLVLFTCLIVAGAIWAAHSLLSKKEAPDAEEKAQLFDSSEPTPPVRPRHTRKHDVRRIETPPAPQETPSRSGEQPSAVSQQQTPVPQPEKAMPENASEKPSTQDKAKPDTSKPAPKNKVDITHSSVSAVMGDMNANVTTGKPKDTTNKK